MNVCKLQNIFLILSISKWTKTSLKTFTLFQFHKMSMCLHIPVTEIVPDYFAGVKVTAIQEKYLRNWWKL